MARFLVNKTSQMVVVILLATFVTFTLIYFSPGDPAEMILTAQDMVPTQETLDRTREEMGLNEPYIVQYYNWLRNVLRGDLGNSFRTNTPAFEAIMQRVPTTGFLAALAFILLVISSVILGVLSAVFHNKLIDFLIRGLVIIGISIPTFWLGLLLIYNFVVRYDLFTITEPQKPVNLILPVLTLAIPLIGRYTRLIRASVLEELSQDYVISARARGLKEPRIIFRHVLPNALTGIITLLGMSVASLLGGTVVVEKIFLIPGLGSLALEAISYRDYPVIQGYVILMSIVYVIMSFLVDVVTKIIDPRILVAREGKS